MSYKFIIHPNNEKLYSIHSRVGRQLLQGYLQQHGGTAPKPVPKPKADVNVDDVNVADIDVNVDDVDAKPVDVVNAKPDAEAVKQNVEAKQEHKNKKVVSLEDPIRARIKAQWAPWVARWEQLVELLRGNKTKEGQSGGNGDYMKNVLTFIV